MYHVLLLPIFHINEIFFSSRSHISLFGKQIIPVKPGRVAHSEFPSERVSVPGLLANTQPSCQSAEVS